VNYRILVTGSRTWDDEPTLCLHLGMAVQDARTLSDVVIVHGACPHGADRIADIWARNRGMRIERHPAENHPTKDFGPWPYCGPLRNQYMVQLGADVCLAFVAPCANPKCRKPKPHDSHGATHCADLAEKAGIPTRRWTS
jgi:hypothetical protein